MSGSPSSAKLAKALYRNRTGKELTPAAITPPWFAPKPSVPKAPPVFVPPVFTGFTKPSKSPPKIPIPSAPQLPPGTILVKKKDVEALQEAAKKQQEVEIVPYPYIPKLPRKYTVSRATGQVGRRIGRGAEFEHMLASKKFAVRRLGGLF